MSKILSLYTRVVGFLHQVLAGILCVQRLWDNFSLQIIED